MADLSCAPLAAEEWPCHVASPPWRTCSGWSDLQGELAEGGKASTKLNESKSDSGRRRPGLGTWSPGVGKVPAQRHRDRQSSEQLRGRPSISCGTLTVVRRLWQICVARGQAKLDQIQSQPVPLTAQSCELLAPTKSDEDGQRTIGSPTARQRRTPSFW